MSAEAAVGTEQLTAIQATDDGFTLAIGDQAWTIAPEAADQIARFILEHNSLQGRPKYEGQLTIEEVLAAMETPPPTPTQPTPPPRP